MEDMLVLFGTVFLVVGIIMLVQDKADSFKKLHPGKKFLGLF